MSEALTEAPTHEPPVISIDLYQEGGYTFLKRALQTALTDPEGKVVIDSGGLKLTYENRSDNTTFMDGITQIDGEAPESLEDFRSVADAYRVQQGLAEIAQEAQATAQSANASPPSAQ